LTTAGTPAACRDDASEDVSTIDTGLPRVSQ
jgi:hypothetical protein